jgi:SAM-dependent methyltransferase
VQLLPINEEVLAVGCALALQLMNMQWTPEHLGASRLADVDVSGVYPTSKLTYGFTTVEPGYFGKRFISYTNSLPPSATIIDIGPAWRGVTVVPVLAQGHTVHAVDREADELRALAWSARDASKASQNSHLKQWQEKLRMVHGALPDRLPFASNSVDAVMAGSVLHFLTPKEVILAMDEIFRVLRPGGRVFIEAQTPYMKGLREHLSDTDPFSFDPITSWPVSNRWPWQLDNSLGQMPMLGKVKYLNLFDLGLVVQVLKATGFVYNDDDVGYFARTDYPDNKTWNTEFPLLRDLYSKEPSYLMRFESVGGVGIKPKSAAGGH